jgi:type III secretion protein Q
MTDEIRLPVVSPENAAFRNMMFSRRGDVALKLGGGEFLLGFPPEQISVSFAASVYGKWGEAEFAVYLESVALLQFAAQALGIEPENVETLPTEITGAALAAFLDPALEILQKASGRPVSIKEIRIEHKEPLPGAEPVVFQLLKKNDGVACRGALLLIRDEGGETKDLLYSLLSGLPLKESVEPDDLPVELRFQVGCSLLQSHDLENLECGDIIFCDEYFPGDDQSLQVMCGRGFIFTGRLGGSGIEISGRCDMSGEKEKPEEAGQGSLADLNSVDIYLSFDIGAKTVTLAELKELASGSVLETDRTLKSPVTVRANGKALARGELVDVAGKIGVRLTEMKS